MRLFISIDPSDEQKDALLNVQDQIYSQGIHGNYTAEDNLHLTLAFIGDYPDADNVLYVLETISFSPFTVTLNGFGNFQNLWWVGVKESSGLDRLAGKIRHVLADNDIPFDRKKFSAHITVLRKADKDIAGITVPEIASTVDYFSLMRSDRGKYNMIYTEIGRIYTTEY